MVIYEIPVSVSFITVHVPGIIFSAVSLLILISWAFSGSFLSGSFVIIIHSLSSQSGSCLTRISIVGRIYQIVSDN